MARTAEQIYTVLTDKFQTEMAAVSITIDPSAWSKVNLLRLIFYVAALAMVTIEQLFDQTKADVNETISKMKPHSRRWYAEKSKAFQYGYPLIPDSDQYDNSLLTQIQIDASKVIKHAAVVEQDRGLRIKVAVITGGDLAQASGGVMTAFSDYIETIKDAGIKITKTSGPPDDLKAKLRIFYNPQVLTSTGARIDGTAATPVQDALDDYLKNLPFNGLFVPMLVVDELEKVDGVVIAKDDYWQTRYGALAYASVDFEYNPDAGYLRVVSLGLDITFIPHAVI